MKRIISMLVAAIMILVLLPASAMTLFAETTVWDGSIATGFARGTGTEADPYIIETAPQLAFLASRVNSGATNYAYKYIKLTSNIELNNTSNWGNWNTTAPANIWTPIGDGGSKNFSGTFDGGGHTISGVYFNTTGSYQGLFGGIVSGTIKCLGVIESYIKGQDYIGGVAGVSISSTISNCYNAGTVNGSAHIGGVTGYFSGAVNNCYNTGTVNGALYAGGVAGDVYGAVSNCYNAGAVNGVLNIGGVAGLVTENGVVNYCYNVGAVEGANESGGVVGKIYYGTVSNCYNAGAVSGLYKTGGVVGIVGNGTVFACYNAGMISGDQYVGGVVGHDAANGTYSYCYYLSGTASGGINGADVVGHAIALTDAQMRLPSSYGWNFLTIWEFGGIDAGYNYPTLIASINRVTFSDDSITVNIGGTKQLTALVLPVTGTNKNVTWSSSDNEVATVSSSGLVTALKYGTAVITVTTQEGGFTDTCTVIAVNTADEADYAYTISNNQATITDYLGSGDNFVIVPTYLGGYPVTSIGADVFSGYSTITFIYIPVGITTVSQSAFSGCANLRFVYFMGNAPTVGGTGLSDAFTVFYRITTSGWDNPIWTGRAIGIVPGDLNGSSAMNMTDAVLFIQRLAQGDSAHYTDKEFVSIDITRDGAVNMADIVKLVQALANPSIILY